MIHLQARIEDIAYASKNPEVSVDQIQKMITTFIHEMLYPHVSHFDARLAPTVELTFYDIRGWEAFVDILEKTGIRRITGDDE